MCCEPQLQLLNKIDKLSGMLAGEKPVIQVEDEEDGLSIVSYFLEEIVVLIVLQGADWLYKIVNFHVSLIGVLDLGYIDSSWVGRWDILE